MKPYRLALLLALTLSTIGPGRAQPLPSVPVWPDGAPDAVSDGGDEVVRVHEPTGDHVVSNVHEPSIIPYLPSEEDATGIAVVIAPGGAHREIWIDHEGHHVAERLRQNGIAAFVLKYRLARAENSPYTVDHSVQDMLRAVRLVRSRASEWHLDAARIGVMGFSAGGQVAALTDVRADRGRPGAADPVEAVSSKPDFQILIYPAWTNDIVLSEKSAPAFILGGFQDMESISTGMAEMYLRFKEHDVPAELHIYANADHGFGIRPGDAGPSSAWPAALIAWLLEVNGIGDGESR